MKKRIVITGATGFIGRQLVPRLLKNDFDLLLVGRNTDEICHSFENIECCNYQQLPARLKQDDIFIHLAVLNNSSQKSQDEFIKVNADLLYECASFAKASAACLFVNISSIQALDSRNRSPYAKSKRIGLEKLNTVKGLCVHSYYLPLVYGDSWSGKLRFLNHIPKSVAKVIFPFFAALKPTLHIDKLLDSLIGVSEAPVSASRVLTDGQSKNTIFKVFKRFGDLTFALVTVACLWWLFLIIWFLIRLESKGPGIFVQDRVGQDGKIFKCFKFRTMRVGTVQAGTHQVSNEMVTKVGQFLRKTKLDELPQVVNILKNEVTLVGPRPCLPQQSALVAMRQKQGVLATKPGITGWAQIHGIDMSNPELLVKWDAEYLALRSIIKDLSIMIATGLGRGQGDRVQSFDGSIHRKAA